MEYLSLGKIIDKFGLDGTIKIYSTTNQGSKRYKKDAAVFLYNEHSQERVKVKVVSYRAAGQFDFVKFDGFDANKAESVKGFEVQVIKDSKDLDVGYYFYSDLRGCKVVNNQRKVLGIVSEVEEFPAQITLRVKRENGKDFFVPFIKQFINKIDIETKEISINVLEGML